MIEGSVFNYIQITSIFKSQGGTKDTEVLELT